MYIVLFAVWEKNREKSREVHMLSREPYTEISLYCASRCWGRYLRQRQHAKLLAPSFRDLCLFQRKKKEKGETVLCGCWKPTSVLRKKKTHSLSKWCITSHDKGSFFSPKRNRQPSKWLWEVLWRKKKKQKSRSSRPLLLLPPFFFHRTCFFFFPFSFREWRQGNTIKHTDHLKHTNLLRFFLVEQRVLEKEGHTTLFVRWVVAQLKRT